MQLDLFSLEDKYPDGEVKECRMCGIKKPMTHAYFAIDRHSSKGKPFYRTACRICERNKRIETEEIKRNSPPPKDRVCDCCGKEVQENETLNMDHCAETKLYRGYLCTNCNTGIGKLGDNAEGLEKALAYVKRTTND